MGLFAFAVIGVLVGLLARAVMPADDPGGALFTSVIGLVGGLAGGVYIGFFVGVNPLEQFFSLLPWAGALGGSVVLLTFYQLISAQRA